MIDITKKYKTCNGREVRIYATDGGGSRPVHGAVIYDGEWFPRHWTAKGTTFEDNEQCRDDLIEVKPRIQREVWVNVYDVGFSTYGTKEMANRCAVTAARLACVKITIDCEEGEGL